MERYAPFHSAKEGDTTFLNDRSDISAPKRLVDCKARKIYVYKHVYDHMQGSSLTVHFDMHRLIACSNPRLAFMKELIDYKTRMEAKDYYEDKSVAGIPIGPDTHIYYTDVGADCTIGSHTTIGLPALAIERDEEDDKIYRFPHIGRVILGNNVWIGSQTNISRGSLDDTIIGDNVTIDCHVHIAHNVHIGENTLVTAGATIGGSVTIGNNCWIGLGSTISNHLSIGNNVLVAAGATVIKDVEDRDIVGGVPARSIKNKCHLPDHKLYQMVGYTSGKT